MHALVVVWKGDFEAIDAIVELCTAEAVRLSVVSQEHLRVLLEDEDKARQARVIMLHYRHRVLVLCNDLLQLFVRSHVLLTNLVTSLHVLKKGLISLLLATAWASEVEKLHDLAHAIVESHGLLPAAAVLRSAAPASLSLDTGLTVEAIALRALLGERTAHKLAQTAHK